MVRDGEGPKGLLWGLLNQLKLKSKHFIIIIIIITVRLPLGERVPVARGVPAASGSAFWPSLVAHQALQHPAMPLVSLPTLYPDPCQFPNNYF